MAVAEDGKDAALSDDNPETAEEEEKKELTELEKYWKAVKDNSADFTGWTYLLQYVEQENDIDSAREAFDSFLQRYPYCYGYWKKYADIEKKHGDMELSGKVFEKGLEAIPLSIDLWVHYISYCTSQWENEADLETKLRKLHEKALTAAGTDFLSDKLWDKFISWEKENKNLRNVTRLYDKLLAIPTQLYSHHFENFTQHVKTNHPKDIVDLDEFLRLRQKTVVDKGHSVEESEDAVLHSSDSPPPPGADISPPGAELPPGEEAPPGVVPTTNGDDGEVKLIREEMIEMRSIVHKRTEEEVSRRWGYEEGIRRPYFHVKPLERAQLKNWKEYLDFEIEMGSHERVVVLFERCMIACALYEEFWIKYANYLEPHSSEGVRNVYKRACTVHLPKKPNIHLNWAAFEEKQGNYDGAMQIIENLEKVLSGLAMVSLRKINLLRRMRNYKDVKVEFQKYIETASNTDLKCFYSIKYARFLSKVMDDYISAKGILLAALKEDRLNIKLHLQLIDLEFQQKRIDEDALIRVFDDAIKSEFSIDQRIAFSQRKLEFLEDLGSDGSRVTETYDEHQKLMKELQSSKKRKADTSEDGASKKPKSETVAAATATSTTTTTTATTATTTNGSGDTHAAVTSQTLSQQTADQQQHQPPQHHPGHMDPHQYNYGANPWGAYNQGGYHGWNQGWNYGYGGYGGQ